MSRIVASVLLLTFLFRMLVLYSPGISTINALSSGLNGESTGIIDNHFKNYSTTPAPDLNIPMVKDVEENLKEQLLKCVKHPLPFLIFTFYVGFIICVDLLSAWGTLGLRRRRASRLYLSISILRI